MMSFDERLYGLSLMMSLMMALMRGYADCLLMMAFDDGF
jgi:hypothetical protein